MEVGAQHHGLSRACRRIRNRSPVLIRCVPFRGADDARNAELSCHDRAVAHMSADIDDNAARGDERETQFGWVVARTRYSRARRRRPVVRRRHAPDPSTTPGFTPTPAIGPVSGARWLSGWIGAGTPTHASGSVVALDSTRRCRRSATSVHVCGVRSGNELVEREVEDVLQHVVPATVLGPTAIRALVLLRARRRPPSDRRAFPFAVRNEPGCQVRK